jgi:Protein of unknown function (DUF3568)
MEDAMTDKIIAVLAAIGLLSTQGCAAVGLTLFGAGAGVTAGTGVSYSLDSIAYKTFTASLQGLHGATRQTLRQMDIAVQEDQPTASGRTLVAAAGDRTIEIALDRLTARTSRMRVNAKQGWFFKDRATEIIVQTARTLEDEPVLSKKAK